MLRHVSRVLALLLVCGSANAIPMPLVGVDQYEGYVYLVGPKAFAYDASTGLVTYRAIGGGDVYDLTGSLADDFFNRRLAYALPSLFEWSAVLDETGKLMFGGAATLAIDFGSGLELVASGTVVDFQFDGNLCNADYALCLVNRPWAKIQNTYTGGAHSDLFADTLLWGGSLSFAIGYPLSNIDVNCPSSPDFQTCSRWSNDFIWGVRDVPEPSVFALVLAAGVGLVAVRRRRRFNAAA